MNIEFQMNKVSFSFSISKISFIIFWCSQFVAKKKLWYCYLLFYDLESFFSLDAFNSITIDFQQFYHGVLLSGFLFLLFCLGFIEVLGSMGLHFSSYLEDVLSNRSLNIFLFLLLSSETLATCIYQTAFCCPIGHYGSVNLFFRLFYFCASVQIISITVLKFTKLSSNLLLTASSEFFISHVGFCL